MLLFSFAIVFTIVETAVARDPICRTCAGLPEEGFCDPVTIGYGCAWDVNGWCYDASPCGPH